MSPAGYSGTPLLQKLGVKPEYKMLVINPPVNYFELLQTDVTDQLATRNETPDWIHLFVKSNKEFESEMKKLLSMAKRNPAITIWVSWHKKSSGIATDVTEDVIRNFALKNRLVDVKVCAVGDVWSGLKLVVPLKHRQ
jgi:hypothetical protein